MRLLFGLLAISASLCAYSLPELPSVSTANFQPAIRNQIEKAHRQAAAHPGDSDAVGAFAMTLHAYEQYPAAERTYLRAHLLDTRNFDWLYLLGAVQMQLGKFDEAAKSFQAALQIRPDLAASLRLAQSLTAISNWDEAASVYKHIREQHPDSPQAFYGQGRVQSALGDHAAAAQSYAKACDLFPSYGAAHFALARELRRLGRSAEADQQLAAYEKVSTTEPPLDDPLFKRIHDLNGGSQTHIRAGMELEKAGKLDEAIQEEEEALTIDPDNVQVHVNLLSLYGRTGQAAKAKQHFDAAIKLNPGRSDAWYDYGVLLFQQRSFTEAEQALRRAVEIDPSYAEAHNNLGVIYEQQGRVDDAAQEFRTAIADRPDFPLARFHLGRILVNQQKYSDAIEQFSKALVPADEKTPVYIYALAATYARAGDREHALDYLQKARDAALAYGQSQLLASIDRDLNSLK